MYHQNIFGSSSKNLRQSAVIFGRCSASLLGSTGEWPEIFVKSSKTASSVCLNNKKEHHTLARRYELLFLCCCHSNIKFISSHIFSPPCNIFSIYNIKIFISASWRRIKSFLANLLWLVLRRRLATEIWVILRMVFHSTYNIFVEKKLKCFHPLIAYNEIEICFANVFDVLVLLRLLWHDAAKWQFYCFLMKEDTSSRVRYIVMLSL